ncbi:hypothetical protein CDAR_434121 [Caerostris darwini]|uniref:Uncharacterized protein n=1 Tax=Caerostris darwini TaxID=1538125 RepID=A0AAV4WF56_9ARAC|nr:hypothetical protein CDAR_434121 [Caerostris darwini]
MRQAPIIMISVQLKEFSFEQFDELNDKRFSPGAQKFEDDIDPHRILEEFNSNDFDKEFDDLTVPSFTDRNKIRKDAEEQISTSEYVSIPGESSLQNPNNTIHFKRHSNAHVREKPLFSIDKRNDRGRFQQSENEDEFLEEPARKPENFKNQKKDRHRNKMPGRFGKGKPGKVMLEEGGFAKGKPGKVMLEEGGFGKGKRGKDRLEEGEFGKDKPGKVMPEEGRFGKGKPGKDMLEEGRFGKAKHGKDRLEEGRFGKGKPGKDRLGKGYNMMPDCCPPQKFAGRKKFKPPKFEYRFGPQKAKMRPGIRRKFKPDPGAEDEGRRMPGPGRFKDRKMHPLPKKPPPEEREAHKIANREDEDEWMLPNEMMFSDGYKRLFKKAVTESTIPETTTINCTTTASELSSTLPTENKKEESKRQTSDEDEFLENLKSGGFKAQMFHERLVNRAEAAPEKGKKRETSQTNPSTYRQGEKRRLIKKSINDSVLQANISTTEDVTNTTLSGSTEPSTTQTSKKRSIKRQVPNQQNGLHLVKLIYKIQEQQLESIFDNSNSTTTQKNVVPSPPSLSDKMKMQMLRSLGKSVGEKRLVPVIINQANGPDTTTNFATFASNQNSSPMAKYRSVTRKSYKVPMITEEPSSNELEQSLQEMKSLYHAFKAKNRDIAQELAEDSKQETERQTPNSIMKSDLAQELMERDLSNRIEVSSALSPSMQELMGASLVKNADSIERQQVGETGLEERPNSGERQNLNAKMYKFFSENSGGKNNDLGGFQSKALNYPAERVDRSVKTSAHEAKLRRTRNSLPNSDDEEVDESDNLDEETEDLEESTENSKENEEVEEEHRRDAGDGNSDSVSSDHVENANILTDDTNVDEDEDYEETDEQRDYGYTEFASEADA